MRRFAYECLHDPFDRKSRITNGVLSFLIIFSIAVLPLEFLPSDYEWVSPHLEFLEKFIVTLFVFEYILRFWSEPRPFRFIFSWEGLIDLVAILPFFLEKFDLFQSAGIFVILRIFRIFKFITIFQLEQSALGNTSDKARYNHIYTLENEEIIRIVFKHPFVFIANLLWPILLTSMSLSLFVIAYSFSVFVQVISVFILLSAIVLFIKFWLDFNFDTLFITNFRIIIQDHQLFGATVNALRYESIMNIIPDNRGLLQWLLQMGRVEIETAAELQKPAIFKNIRQPHVVARTIEHQRQLAIDSSGTGSV